MVPILPELRERSANGNASIDPLQHPAFERVEPSRTIIIPRSGAGPVIESNTLSRRGRNGHSAARAGAIICPGAFHNDHPVVVAEIARAS
jgi:hypothetical protein